MKFEFDEGNMEYTIRKIKENEIDFLEDFLYEAIFIPEGVKPPAKKIIFQPELQVYISDFGKCKGDIGLVAELNNKIVGAVWVRIMNDYGHIDDNTPSVAISLYKEYRNLGIGTAMMKTIISTVRTEGYILMDMYDCLTKNSVVEKYLTTDAGESSEVVAANFAIASQHIVWN